MLVGPDVDVSIYSCDKGHTLADLRRSCRVHLSGRRAGTSVMIGNMYMGAESRNGLGSQFDMGHFALIAAYTPGSHTRGSHTRGSHTLGSRAIRMGASTSNIELEASTSPGIESEPCLAIPMPNRKRRGVRGGAAVNVGAGGDGGEEGEKEGAGGQQGAGGLPSQGEMCLVMDVWASASDAYWVPLEKVWRVHM